MKNPYIELPQIWYDVDELKKVVDSIPSYNWYTFGCNNIRWTVRERITKYRLECKNIEPNPFFDELFRFFKGNLSYDRLLFSKTPPPGVPKHIDRTRQSIVNFPVCGTFKNSPQSFWEGFDSESPSHRFFYRKNEKTGYLFPFAFNGQAVHSVENADDEERTVLSIWFDIPFESFRDGGMSFEDLIDAKFDGKFIKLLDRK